MFLESNDKETIVNSELIIKNREVIIDKISGLFQEYKKRYSKYEKIDLLMNRVQRWMTYPMDKVQGYAAMSVFSKKKLLKEAKQYLNQEHRDKKIIVSLTSYPKRIKYAPISIASMLRQTMKPDKIILYLAKEDFPNKKLPSIYKRIRECGVDIRFRKDLKVHTKYYYAFKEYPNDLIITIDDDILYDEDLVERLYKSYQRKPNEVHAAYVNQLTFNDEAHLLGYEDWNYKVSRHNSSHQYMALGVGGVIYNPSQLCEETLNANMIKKLCPTNDDIWLKFMEALSGVKVHNVGIKKTGKILRDTQKGIALGIINMTLGKNDNQIRALVDYYNQYSDNNKTLEEMMAYDEI